VTDAFVAISSWLTGFDDADLLGTGVAGAYLAELQRVIGEAGTAGFLSAAAAALARGGGEAAPTEAAIAADLIANPRLGPIARNVIIMWYLGTWTRLPDGWWGDRARPAEDTDRVISPRTYVEALVWRAAGTHPPGARQPGYGSWSLPPEGPA
jgi:hypothetical protein